MSTPTQVGNVLGMCDHAAAYLARGTRPEQVGWFCSTCTRWVTVLIGRHVGLWLPRGHPDLEGKRLEELPSAGERFYMVCQGCGTAGICELHHWAPRALFGAIADQWPTGYLCRKCHERWHGTVTPGLCTEYNPIKHIEILLKYLSRDHLYALTRALVDYWKRTQRSA